jgi:ABC-type polysaccharide/polyol phosphate transport system ATPase subunit
MAVVSFTNVTLEYPIRENQSVTLKEFVLHGLFRRKQTKGVRSIKALSDLTFSICDGERVGIIGRNGAGKSTLLRTIGGVYPIQSGTRTVAGSICSLFDIGVGFEIDCTGWQNIYFRSYLQGETPRSIKEKLPEIAAFTELGDYLNLPIRCYSTGMLMRLAFAIATARYPEILLVDEVFGTGDLVFQKKAEARMRDFMHRAKIVAMVGHNLEFLEEFSTKVIWLHEGKLHAVGPSRQIIQEYKQSAAQLQQQAA